MNFASQYIGIPWRSNGRTIKGFDCWGLVIHVLYKHFGIRIEDSITADGSRTVERVRAFIRQRDTKMDDWRLVDEPGDGDIVVMGNRHGVPTHCGIYIDNGVLHCEEGIGCVFEVVSMIRWPRLTFYRYQK